MKTWIAAAGLLAILVFAVCRRAAPESAADLAQAAAARHHAHEYAQAVELYQRSLALHPDPLVRANLARALAADQEFRAAAEQYQLLLKDEPQNGALWHDYGLVLESGLKDLQGAEDALFNATKFPPRLPEASYDLGRVLLQHGRYEEAGACFDAAISQAPRNASWLEDAQAQQVQAYLLAKKQPPPPR